MPIRILFLLCFVSTASFAKIQTDYKLDEVLTFVLEEARSHYPQDAKVVPSGVTLTKEGEELKATFSGVLTLSVEDEPCGLEFKVRIGTKTVNPRVLPRRFRGAPPVGGIVERKGVAISFLELEKMGPLSCVPSAAP